MRRFSSLLAYIGFSLVAGFLAVQASGPSPVPWFPVFATGSPTTPPVANNQAYVQTDASDSVWFWNQKTGSWVQVSTGSAGGSGCVPVGSSVLSGNGAGGCANVTIGTGLSFAGGTLSNTVTATAPCTATANAIQYDNAGAFDCAPAIVNSGVFAFTGYLWQLHSQSFMTAFANPGCSGCITDFGIGYEALQNYSATPFNNVECIGYQSCGNVTSAAGDYTAFGSKSCGDGSSASGSAQNVCVGYEAGMNMNGSNGSQTFIGSQAGTNINGNNNVAVGALALNGAGSSTATENVAVGYEAGELVTSAQIDVLLGYEAGASLTSGSNNICIGYFGCPGLTTGSRNMFMAPGQSGYTCAMTSASVNDELDWCTNGTAAGDAQPFLRCNIASISAGTCLYSVPLTINRNAAALPASLTGALVTLGGVDSSVAREQINAYANTAIFTGTRADGTNASPTAVVNADPLSAFNGYGQYDTTPGHIEIAGSFRVYANGTFSNTSAPGEDCEATVASASTTLVDHWCVFPNGGITLDSPTGGNEGVGTINVPGNYYINGTAITAPATYQGTLLTVTPSSFAFELMSGFAGTITPKLSGIVEICLAGYYTNSATTAGAGVEWRPSYGTGVAPGANAALTGTQVGTLLKSTFPTTATAVGNIHQAMPGVCVFVSGLTLGTAYWLDASQEALVNTTNTLDGQISAQEIP